MSDFLSADPNGPNYLKPAPGYGQGSHPNCECEIVPANPVRERAEFQCSKCSRIFPESLVEEVDGKYRMKDFSKYSKGPGRSRRR